MSRIGRLPIAVPSGVDVTIDGRRITVNGPKGTLSRELHPDMTRQRDEGSSSSAGRPSEDPQAAPRADPDPREQHGRRRDRRLSQGPRDHRRRLSRREGRARSSSSTSATATRSRSTRPAGITFEVENPTRLAVVGIDKELVGQIAAQVRSTRKPEPYKGKGVRYAGERSAARPARPARSAARSNHQSATERTRTTR